MRTDAQPKRSPLAFLVLVYIVAVPFWLLGAVVEPPEDFPIKLPVSALQLLAPLIAAAILVHREPRSSSSFYGVRGRWLGVPLSGSRSMLVPVLRRRPDACLGCIG